MLVEQAYGRCVTASPAMWRWGCGLRGEQSRRDWHTPAVEARKLKMDIACNVVVPQANTRMVLTKHQHFSQSSRTRQVSTKSRTRIRHEIMGPEKISAMVGWLAHESCTARAHILKRGILRDSTGLGPRRFMQPKRRGGWRSHTGAHS